jgi:TolB protein
MSQGPALAFRKRLTRRRAIAMALAGALAMPHLGRGQTKKLILAVPDLVSSSDDAGHLAHLTAALVTDDLRGTGQFAPLDSSALITPSATGLAPSGLPRFEGWRAASVDALVTGSVGPAGEKLTFEFRLWDVGSGQQLMGQQYVAQAGDWRQITHDFSGRIYERLIGRQRDFG